MVGLKAPKNLTARSECFSNKKLIEEIGRCFI